VQFLALERAPEGAMAPVRLESVSRAGFVDALRAFLTLLVVAHHSVLAYFPYAPKPSGTLSTKPVLWPAFPVVDSHRWTGIDAFAGFNDTFFMSLMFLISGLFVVPSLRSKGPAAFLKARFRRLGIPFLIGSVLMPIAYYPSYLQRAPGAGFIAEWLSLGSWPAGPMWFLWLLLAFDSLSALLFRSVGFPVFEKPWKLFAALVLCSAAVYLPLTLAFGAEHWLAFGPFAAQTSRIPHYALYFATGAALGMNEGFFAVLRGHWLRWSFAALGCFTVATTLFILWITRHPASSAWQTAANFGFSLSCAGISLAFLALFSRFASKGRALSKSAFGIYLTHYFFVSWLQYLLLPAAWSAPLKGIAVFGLTTLLAWLVTAAARRVRQGFTPSA
jgi:surface polysaccharide O-acyltransferase-like enzyme